MTNTERLLEVSKKIQTWIHAHPRKATIVWSVIHEFDDAIVALEKELQVEQGKTAEEIIGKIPVNRANFLYIADKGKISGSLLIDIKQTMEQYASQKPEINLREELIKYDEYLDEYVDHKRSEVRVDIYLKSKQ